MSKPFETNTSSNYVQLYEFDHAALLTRKNPWVFWTLGPQWPWIQDIKFRVSSMSSMSCGRGGHAAILQSLGSATLKVAVFAKSGAENLGTYPETLMMILWPDFQVWNCNCFSWVNHKTKSKRKNILRTCVMVQTVKPWSPIPSAAGKANAS